MSTTPIDFSKYEAQAPAPQIDFSKYTAAPAQSGPSDDWIKNHYGHADDSSIDQAKQRYQNRGLLDKAIDFIQKPADYTTEHGVNAINAAQSGQYAKAANETVKAATPIATVAAIPGIASAPVTAARAIAGGYLASKVAQPVAQAAGATPDQAELVGNVAGIGGGAVAGTGAIRAFLETPAKAALGKVASAADGVVSDDILGIISPRALHGLKMLRAAARVAGSTEDSAGLSELTAKHTEAISATEQALNDALSKANALPPEGAPQAGEDVMEEARRGGPGTNAQREADIAASRQRSTDFLQKAKDNLAAQGAPASNTPNGALYNEPIAEKTAQQIYAEKFLQKTQPKPSLIDQLKEWDQIRQIHAQLEDQIGKGQDELQQWMEQHNQEAPGARPTSAADVAKARFQAARAAAESKANAIPSEETAVTSKAAAAKDTDFYAQAKAEWQASNPGKDPSSAISQIAQRAQQLKTGPQMATEDNMESLLMKSIQNAKAKKAMSAKAGD